MDAIIQLAENPKYLGDDGIINGLPIEALIEASSKIMAKKRKRGPKKKKAKNAGPKRVSCSFMRWRTDNYEEIKHTYFSDFKEFISGEDLDIESVRNYYKEKGLEEPKFDESTFKKPRLVALISKKAGILWEEVDPSIKEKYEEQFRIEKAKYDEELRLFKEMGPCEEEEIVEFDVPDGWSVMKNKSISKTIKGEDGKTIKMFNTFREAIDKAEELGASCYGITQTKRGFSVRCGPVVDDGKALCSWVKLDFEPPIKGKRGRPSTKPQVIESSDESDNDNDNDNDNDSDDEEDNTIQVEEINVDGKDYYIDRKSKKLYDIETQEVVGIYEEE